MKEKIRKIILENYKYIENDHLGIIEYQPIIGLYEYRIMFKIGAHNINFVINQELLKKCREEDALETVLKNIIDTNILYYYKRRK